jgi:Tol biopolymer transport system component
LGIYKSFFPDENRIIFVAEAYRIALTFSFIGILDIDPLKVSVLNTTPGVVREFIWSPDKRYIVYTLGTARARGEKLAVDNIIAKEKYLYFRQKKNY